METKQPTKFCVASCIQENNKEEAETIAHYTGLLQLVEDSDMDESDKEYIKGEINEIISDELNHQERLNRIYQALTDLVPNSK